MVSGACGMADVATLDRIGASVGGLIPPLPFCGMLPHVQKEKSDVRLSTTAR